MRVSSLAILALVATCSTSCYSQLTGNRAVLAFAYPAVGTPEDFNKPLAPGAELTVQVREPGHDKPLKVVAAESSDAGVLQVVRVWEGGVLVRGNSRGTALLRVRAVKANGDVREDSVDMHVAAPTSTRFAHACTDGHFAVYPAHSKIQVTFQMMRGKQPVIGYGFWPIKVSPASSLKLDKESTTQGVLEFETGKPRHRVAIRSRIDASLLGLALAEPEEIDGVVYPADFLPPLVVAERAGYAFQPTIAGVPFCQVPVRTRATSQTPGICTVSTQIEPDGPDENLDGIVVVTGRSYGVCKFVVEFPDAANGKGVRESFRVAVGDFPTVDAQPDRERDAPSQPPNQGWLAPLLALLVPLIFAPLVWLLRSRR